MLSPIGELQAISRSWLLAVLTVSLAILAPQFAVAKPVQLTFEPTAEQASSMSQGQMVLTSQKPGSVLQIISPRPAEEKRVRIQFVFLNRSTQPANIGPENVTATQLSVISHDKLMAEQRRREGWQRFGAALQIVGNSLSASSAGQTYSTYGYNGTISGGVGQNYNVYGTGTVRSYNPYAQSQAQALADAQNEALVAQFQQGRAEARELIDYNLRTTTVASGQALPGMLTFEIPSKARSSKSSTPFSITVIFGSDVHTISGYLGPIGAAPPAAASSEQRREQNFALPNVAVSSPQTVSTTSPAFIAMPEAVHIPDRAPIGSGGRPLEITRLGAGVAIKVQSNEPVFATADGTVEFVGTLPGLKSAVRVAHGGEIETVYANLDKVSVAPKVHVGKGWILGFGATAEEASTIVYEVKVAGSQVNPIPFLPQAQLVIAPHESDKAALAGVNSPPISPDAVAREVRQANVTDLNSALSRLGKNPRDIRALFDAGNAASRLGNEAAKQGFFARANALQRSEANAGLALDLKADNLGAQRIYRNILEAGNNDEVVRCLAVSLAISGDEEAMFDLLAPQLKRQVKAGFRAYAFALAILGKHTEAIDILNRSLPRELAGGIAPYLRYMTRLTASQKAYAVFSGAFPTAIYIGNDDKKWLNKTDEDFNKMYKSWVDLSS